MNFLTILMTAALIIFSACTKPVEAPKELAVQQQANHHPNQQSFNEATSNTSIGVSGAVAESPKTEETFVAPAISEKTTQILEPKAEKPAITNWLAKLDSMQNRVEFRQRNESIWKPTEIGMIFARFDALQTQNQASAKVVYQSGSNLDVKDNTLLIFDHDPGKKKKSEDRVIVKNGELIGSTKTELWVFTNAGLVQIKPEAKTKIAKAKVSIQSDEKIQVKVDTGTADVVFKPKDNAPFEKIHVAPKSDVEITSAVKLVDTTNSVSAVKLEEIAVAAEKVVKLTKAELIVEYPVDGAISSEAELTAKGRLTAAGGKLLINGEFVELREDFSFSKKITLQPGSNLIVFQVVRSDASVQFMRKSVRLQAN